MEIVDSAYIKQGESSEYSNGLLWNREKETDA